MVNVNIVFIIAKSSINTLNLRTWLFFPTNKFILYVISTAFY